MKMPQAQTCTQVKVATPICGCDDNTSRNNCERQSKLVALEGQPSQVRYGRGFGIYNEMINRVDRLRSQGRSAWRSLVANPRLGTSCRAVRRRTTSAQRSKALHAD